MQLKELSTQVKLIEQEKSAMEEAIAQLADDRDEIEAMKDTAILNREELQSRVSELEQHLEMTSDKLQVNIIFQSFIIIIPHSFLYYCFAIKLSLVLRG